MSEQKSRGGSSSLLVIGVLSVFLLGEAQFIMNPALAALGGEFPEIPFSTISYLATIPSLIAVPMGVISGFLIKKGLGYRKQIILASAIVVIGGVIPYWVHNFSVWIACRILFGIGFGVCVPMSGTLAQRTFSGEQAARVQGWGATAQNLGGVVLQMLSGIVAARNVNTVWLVHLVLVIPLILVILTVPEPEDDASAGNGAETKEGGGLPMMVYIKSVGFGTMFMFMYPFLTSISVILEHDGIGTAAVAGTINSAYTIGGMIAGVIFLTVFKALGKWCMPLMYLLMGAALLGAFIAGSTPMFIAVGVLMGIFVFILWSGHITEFGQTVSPSNMAMASGIFVGLTNLFCFFSSPLVGIVGNVLGDNPRMPLMVGGIGCLVIGAVYVVGALGKKA